MSNTNIRRIKQATGLFGALRERASQILVDQHRPRSISCPSFRLRPDAVLVGAPKDTVVANAIRWLQTRGIPFHRYHTWGNRQVGFEMVEPADRLLYEADFVQKFAVAGHRGMIEARRVRLVKTGRKVRYYTVPGNGQV